ncbi:MAG: PAS domain-containing protein [Pseudomonadota bacterium]
MTRPFYEFISTALDASDQSEVEGHSAVICLAEPGHPVLFVSEEFEAHTGFTPAEAIGRNLSFLQGPETEPEAVELFRHLLRTGGAGTIRITNYRKDKSPFLHECDLRPVKDASGNVTHFIAIQRPI